MIDRTSERWNNNRRMGLGHPSGPDIYVASKMAPRCQMDEILGEGVL